MSEINYDLVPFGFCVECILHMGTWVFYDTESTSIFQVYIPA